ncbi:FIMAH domain-containing protein [Ruania zhangjianzhongii]|uniref:FIMAH domain-containing protein n=1 Tax=Ruania zhangjianzhongii TaxID=2603206 RepID=UPI0011C835FE|nr:hypothetical protein [Ruania zhangjianzhongii]
MSSSSPPPIGRRIATGALAAAVSLGLVATGAAADGPTADEPAQEGLDLSVEITDHGLVATETSISSADVGTLPDGTHVQYLPAAGNPASFSVVNIETGELIDHQSIPPKTLAGPTEILPDGSAYFALRDGGGVILYHWDAETHEITEVLENPAGELLIRGLQMHDGILYGNTYARAKVFSYDPATGDVRDYGSVASDDDYAWGLSVVDGTAYTGTGMQTGHAVAVDLDSGEMTELELPAEYDEVITYFYSFQQVGDLIAMGFSPSLNGSYEGVNTLFWDTAAGDWACEGAIGSFLSLNAPFTDQTERGTMFFKSEGEIWEFDSADCSVSPTGWIDTGLEDTGNHRALNLLTTADGEEVLVGLNRDGSFWRFTPATGEHEVFDGVVPGAPLTAHSVHVASDDRVYMGTYNGPGTLGRFDPATQEMDQIDGPSQADSWLNFQDQLVLGSYGNAVVHMGDPAAEWDYGTNPAEQFRLIDEEQDRIIDMATNGDIVAMATVSDYGVRGGGLTLTDMTDRGVTYRDLVEAQSTTAVTFGGDGLIYAGTSVQGGLSSPDSPQDAHLVVVDPETGEVLDSVVPVPDNRVVAEVVALGETIWALTTTGDLVEYDTTTREVVEVYDVGADTSASTWGLGSTIQVNPADGLLYGIAGTDVFAFDPETRDLQILAEDGYKRMDIAEDGTVYVIDATNLYSFDVSGAEQGPVEQLEALSAATEGYIEAGDITGPIAHQLQRALDQAEKHLSADRTVPAVRALERFVRHLDNAKVPDTVTEEARAGLVERAEAILDALG